MSTAELAIPQYTADEIRDQILARSSAAFMIGSAADEPVEAQFDGTIYRWEPGEAKRITAHYDWPRDKKGNLITTNGRRVKEGMTPENVAAELMSRGSQRGLFMLFSDGQDNQRQAVARTSYMAWRLERARSVQASWLRTVQKATADPGALPPVQPEYVRNEIDWLGRYKAGTIGRKAFVSFDGRDFDHIEEAIAYVNATFPTEVENHGGDPTKLIRETAKVAPGLPPQSAAPVAARQPPPNATPKPGPEPQLDAADFAFVVEKADRLKVGLSPSELIGLMKKDGDVLKNVLTKLAAVELGGK